MPAAVGARGGLVAGMMRLARAAGIDVVSRNFYSPVPAWQELRREAFERRGPLHGIEFDLDVHAAFLTELAPFLREFESPPGFMWDNHMYGPVDADVLYAMVRHLRPQRVIELGSGFSSLIIAHAIRQNQEEAEGGRGEPVQYTAWDPYARDFIERGVSGLELKRTSALDVPAAEFERLASGDILFIDTTHTVKLGSEVNRLILDVLPLLRPGVFVHIHDIFLPYEYPRSFFERRMYWNEQYLLQAFLCQNSAWEVSVPLHALAREQPATLRALVRSYRPDAEPGAFWMRRR
jgi:hypothetical protein